ncbi:uncharacterized protein LOC103514701 [Diaphorina citri]|uniref:Uncharacterized protein LOC103514701 n=1 Tax=Diaphorina citri TaxID=121845 RepID=A0A1S3DAI4_DIACI|nr:uncharacterized protein LOC103514701 [Diaphorina citri]
MPPNDPAIVQHQISHPPPSAAPGYPGVVQPTHTHAYSHHLGAAPGSHLMAGSMGASHHVHPSVSAGGYNPMSGMTFTREPHKPLPVSHVGAHPVSVGHEPPSPRPSQNQNSVPNMNHQSGGSSGKTNLTFDFHIKESIPVCRLSAS